MSRHELLLITYGSGHFSVLAKLMHLGISPVHFFLLIPFYGF